MTNERKTKEKKPKTKQTTVGDAFKELKNYRFKVDLDLTGIALALLIIALASSLLPDCNVTVVKQHGDTPGLQWRYESDHE